MGTPAAVVETQSTTDWKASLPEDLRGDPSIQDIKDLPGLVKSHANAQKMIGNSLRMPAPDADQKEWDTFYSRAGRPDKPESYQIERPKLPDNVEYDQEMEGLLRLTGHAAGLTQRQLQKLVDEFNKFSVNRIIESDKQMEADREAGIAELKQKWGGSYDRNTSLAFSAIEKFGGSDLRKELDDLGVGSNPKLMRAFAIIGEKMLEDGHVTGNAVSMQDEKAALEKEATELRKGPLSNRMQGREYQDAQQRLTAITARLLEIEGGE